VQAFLRLLRDEKIEVADIESIEVSTDSLTASSLYTQKQHLTPAGCVIVDGKEYRCRSNNVPKGHPSRPLSTTEIDRKCVSNAEHTLSSEDANTLLATLKSGGAASARQILQLTGGPRRGRQPM
jgi:2-methylcitrate dehydratase PrpD